MRRAERLFRLVAEMRARSICRAEDLARVLEVSTRTIYRDIEHLQASGLPIDGEAGVGYMLRPGFDLTPVTFTHDQLEALALALSFAESLDDVALAGAAREVRAKLQAGLPDPAQHRLIDAPYFALRRSTGAPAHAALIRQSIRHRQVVEMTYADAQGVSSSRRVQPLAIWTLAEGWMFSGWCEKRGDFRTIRFDRITGLAATGESFAQDPARGLTAFLAADHCEGAADRAEGAAG